MHHFFAISVAILLSASNLYSQAELSKPIRLKVGDTPIRVESPGYAAPFWADINGDAKPELLLGQFARGRINVYPHLGKMNFGTPDWLRAEGKILEVDGIW